MGWSSGSELFEEVMKAVRPFVSDDIGRKALYIKLIDAFQDQDWDCLEEVLGIDPAYDAAYKHMYPDEA